MTDIQTGLSDLEERIGYRFTDRSLLLTALTHSSYANEQRNSRVSDYERIEFLGDAVLELVSSDFLYRTYPDLHEGDMTKLRSSLVCEPALAYCARDFGLEKFIRLGHGEEHTGGRQRDSIVSDVCEAVIGAMYLDSGSVDAPSAFIHRFILSDLEDKQLFYDAKTRLQEIVQAEGGELTYIETGEEGPEHDKTFHAAAVINGVPAAEGSGHTKKQAEQRAAYSILKQRKENHTGCI